MDEKRAEEMRAYLRKHGMQKYTEKYGPLLVIESIGLEGLIAHLQSILDAQKAEIPFVCF